MRVVPELCQEVNQGLAVPLQLAALLKVIRVDRLNESSLEQDSQALA